MKTPPNDLPPVPEGFAYIGVDDGSIIEEGCEGDKGLWTGNYLDRAWTEFEVLGGPSRKTGRQVLAPTGSRLHMRNSVPDGFDYYGMGPLKNISDTWSEDIRAFRHTESGGWENGFQSRGTSPLLHYALRSGSPIALANGLVPPAPAETFYQQMIEKKYGRLMEEVHSMPVPPMPTTEAAAARTLVEAMADQIRELKADLAAAQSGNRILTEEIDAMKRDNRQVFQRAREHLKECDSLRTELAATRMANDMARTELARVRETLRGFYAAAEAMAKEGAK